MVKVAVAMSGGVDSSVSAILLKKGLTSFKEEIGEVVGITFFLFSGQEKHIERAKIVAEILEIKHQIIDIREIFREKIVEYFLKSYGEGLTPNPCALCNRLIKFGLIPDWIEKTLGATYFATGHYVEKGDLKGHPLLKVSNNRSKDQSYFLALVRSEMIGRLVFPVGSLSSKEEVRKIAQSYGLNFFEKEESQDVCFLRGKTLKEYLKEHFSEREGEIIFQDRVVGTHRGFYFYTIGQRKGLNIPLGKPVYVIKIDAKENRIYLGEKRDLLRRSLYLEEINFHLPFEKWENPLAQIRYRSEKVPVKDIIKEDSYWKIVFEREVSGVAPGQVCAFYEGDFLLGGGIIIRESA